MRVIHIIDTTVYLIILNVPHHDGIARKPLRPQIMQEFEKFCNEGNTLLLPFGTIIEAGTHISDSDNGRKFNLIKKFTQNVQDAISKKMPYTLCGIPRGSGAEIQILQWIRTYREYAQSGLSLVDSMSVDIFNEMKDIYPDDHVRIWSYDRVHLDGYDTHPMTD